MKMKTSVSVVIRMILWLAMIAGGTAFSLIRDWHTPLFHDLPFHLITALLGYLILVLAFRAAANGGKELAKGRTGDIPRLETNRLVTSGLYSCMRHPMLFGLTLLPLGWALLTGSPTFIFILAPLEMLFIIIMVILFEEREVNQKFGKAYQAYKKKVPMVSFQWECLKILFAKVHK